MPWPRWRNAPGAPIRPCFPWLARRPLKALDLADSWDRLLAVTDWILTRGAGRYLRQVDIPGVDTKFIGRHRGVLAELLDLMLPPGA